MGRARIVLADDHQEFLACTAGLLRSEFDVVETVADGEALIEAAERIDPDILVIDISMPGVNGIEAVRRIKAAGCTARVVFLSMHQDHDYIEAALATGADCFVAKNSLATDLVPALREALAGRGFVSQL